jgi:hypothetical protein
MDTLFQRMQLEHLCEDLPAVPAPEAAAAQ